MPLQAFYDDSGTKGQHPWMVLGGVLGTIEQIAAMSDEWDKILWSKPRIAYLKLSEATGLNGRFHDWREESRNDKLVLLARAIQQAGLRLVWSSSEIKGLESFRMALKKVLPNATNPPAYSYDPLFWLYARCATNLCQALYSEGHKEPVELIFDEHAKLAPRFRRWYPIIRAAHPYLSEEEARLLPAEPLYRDDKQFMALQAADLVAGIVRRSLCGESDEMDRGVLQEWADIDALADDYSIEEQLSVNKNMAPLLADEAMIKRFVEAWDDEFDV